MAYEGPHPFPVASGGTGKSSTTAYALLAGGTTSTGAFQSLAGLGTMGQVLTSNGAAALPTFQPSATSGSVVLIQSQNASNSASIAFTSTYLTSTYNSYLFLLSGVVPANNGDTLSFQISIDNGANYIASNYHSGFNETPYNTAAWANANSSTNMIIFGTISNTANFGLCCSLNIYNLQNSNNIQCSSNGCVYTSAPYESLFISAGINNITTVNNIKFSMSSGNIASGTFSLYGLQE